MTQYGTAEALSGYLLILFVVTLWRHFVILGRNTHFSIRSRSSVHDMVHKSVEPINELLNLMLVFLSKSLF